MPGRDGRGPGQGRGRGLGLGFECRRNFYPECRRGLRFEEGGGTGRRVRRFWDEDERMLASDKEILEEQKACLQDRLESIEKRLEGLQ